MVTNPAKFRMMFLGKGLDTKFDIYVDGKIIPDNEQVKLLEVTISKIKVICGKVNQKSSALARLRGYISKEKLFLNMVVLSNFQNCPLMWLFCSKAVDNLIKRTTKRAMGIIYNSDNGEELDAILQRDGTLTIHKKNLQKLKVEIH